MAMRDQDQLRMIMATPRGERKPLEAPAKKSSMGPPPGKKKSGKKPSQAYIHKMAMQNEREERPDDAYRDRAKERRSDANPDFRPEDQILADQIAERYEQTPAWEAGQGPVVTGPRKSQEEINKEIEESKFLGGDMEHTHLVKGLDFALLNKMRSELDAKAKKEARARKMMEQLEQDKPERAEAPAPRASQGVVRSSEQPQGEQRKGFQSHVARSIHAQLFGKEEELYGKRRQLESFQPGRMGIEFSLDTEFQTELPTIITRSKSDCPRLSKKVLPQMPEAVLERIEKSMHFIRQCALGKDGKRMKRKARPQEAEAAEEEAHEQDPTIPTEPSAQNDSSMPPPPPPPAAADYSDDDIFAGIGKDYVCEARDKTSEKKQVDGNYFGTGQEEEEEEGLLSQDALKGSVRNAVDAVPEEIKATMKARAIEEAKRARAEKERKLKRMLEDHPDEYAECYAGYHTNVDLSVLMEQSEEKPNKKGKKKAAQDDDKFDPKAEEQRMNNKFNKDYNSIAGIMKDKYDEDIKNEPKRQKVLGI